MNIDYFEYFIEICRTQSINKAAQTLFLSQPVLSCAIKAMEKELGYALFYRSNKGVALTPLGQKFLVSAKVIVNEYKKIKGLSSSAQQNNLDLAFAFSSVFMKSFIEFRERFPMQTEIDFARETGQEYLITYIDDQKIKSPDCRVGITYNFLSSYHTLKREAAQKNISITCIAQDVAVQAIMSAKNPLANKAVLTLSDLKNEKFNMFGGWNKEEWKKGLGVGEVGEPIYVFDRGGMYDLMSNSDAWILALQDLSGRDRKNGCVNIPIESLASPLNVYVLHKSDYTLNQREKKYISYLTKVLTAIKAASPCGT